MEAVSIKVQGIVERVGFRRFVERAAWKFDLFGYVENLKDGSVKVFAQGSRKSLDRLAEEIKSAPQPIVVRKLESKREKTIPSMKSFRIKTGPQAMEMQEGFGAIETQFSDYRDEFRGFARRTDENFNTLTQKTDENFKLLDTKYGEISEKLTHILETLEKESTETRRELTRAVDSLVAAVGKSLTNKTE
ncbi:MAG: acylphosphatase [Nitrososphaerota archaeon]|nr:acylphosphatase [Nitrososphaerota archaeon]